MLRRTAPHSQQAMMMNQQFLRQNQPPPTQGTVFQFQGQNQQQHHPNHHHHNTSMRNPSNNSNASFPLPASSTPAVASTSMPPLARLRHLCLVAASALRFLDNTTFAATISAMGDLEVGTPAFTLPLPRSEVQLGCASRAVELSPLQIAMTLRALAQMSLSDVTIREHFRAHFLKHKEIPLAAVAEMGRAFHFARNDIGYKSFLHELVSSGKNNNNVNHSSMLPNIAAKNNFLFQQQDNSNNHNNNATSTTSATIITAATPESGISMLRSLTMTKICETNSNSNNNNHNEKTSSVVPPEIIVAISAAFHTLPAHLVGVACTSLLAANPDVRQAILPFAIRRLSSLFDGPSLALPPPSTMNNNNNNNNFAQNNNNNNVTAVSCSEGSTTMAMTAMISNSDAAKCLKVLIEGNAPRPVIQNVSDKLIAAAADLSADDVCRALHAISHDLPQLIELRWSEQNVRPLIQRIAKLYPTLAGVHVATCLAAFDQLGLLRHPFVKALIRRVPLVVPELAVEDAANCLRAIHKHMCLDNGGVAISMQAVGEFANYFGPVLCVDSLNNRVGLNRVLTTRNNNSYLNHNNNNNQDSSFSIPFHRVPMSRKSLDVLCQIFVPLCSLLPEHVATADMGSLLLINAQDLSIEQLIHTSLASLRVTALTGGDFREIWNFVVRVLAEKIFDRLSPAPSSSAVSSNKNNKNNALNQQEECVASPPTIDKTIMEKESSLLNSIILLANQIRLLPLEDDDSSLSSSSIMSDVERNNSNNSLPLLVSAICVFIAPRLTKMKVDLLESFLSSVVDLYQVLFSGSLLLVLTKTNNSSRNSNNNEDASGTTTTTTVFIADERIQLGRDVLSKNILSTLERTASVCHTMPPKLAFAFGVGMARLTELVATNNNNSSKDSNSAPSSSLPHTFSSAASTSIATFVLDFFANKLAENKTFLETIETPKYMREQLQQQQQLLQRKNMENTCSSSSSSQIMISEMFTKDFLAGFSDAGELMLNASYLLAKFSFPQNNNNNQAQMSEQFQNKFLFIFQKILQGAEPPSLEVVATIADNIATCAGTNNNPDLLLLLRQTESQNDLTVSPLSGFFFRPLAAFVMKRSDEASLRILHTLAKVCLSLDGIGPSNQQHNNNQSFPRHSIMLTSVVNALFLQHLNGVIIMSAASGANKTVQFSHEENELIQFSQYVVSCNLQNARERFPEAVAILDLVGNIGQGKTSSAVEMNSNNDNDRGSSTVPKSQNQPESMMSSPATSSSSNQQQGSHYYDGIHPSKKPQKVAVPTPEASENNNNNNNASWMSPSMNSNNNNRINDDFTIRQPSQNQNNSSMNHNVNINTRKPVVETFSDEQQQYFSKNAEFNNSNNNNNNNMNQKMTPSHQEFAPNLQMMTSYENIQGRSAFYQAIPTAAAQMYNNQETMMKVMMNNNNNNNNNVGNSSTSAPGTNIDDCFGQQQQQQQKLNNVIEESLQDEAFGVSNNNHNNVTMKMNSNFGMNNNNNSALQNHNNNSNLNSMQQQQNFAPSSSSATFQNNSNSHGPSYPQNQQQQYHQAQQQQAPSFVSQPQQQQHQQMHNANVTSQFNGNNNFNNNYNHQSIPRNNMGDSNINFANFAAPVQQQQQMMTQNINNFNNNNINSGMNNNNFQRVRNNFGQHQEIHRPPQQPNENFHEVTRGNNNNNNGNVNQNPQQQQTASVNSNVNVDGNNFQQEQQQPQQQEQNQSNNNNNNMNQQHPRQRRPRLPPRPIVGGLGSSNILEGENLILL